MANPYIFHGLNPDEQTLSFIKSLEKRGFKLIDTTATDDPHTLTVHKGLEADHGKIFHYQYNATRNGEPIGINLYFKEQN